MTKFEEKLERLPIKTIQHPVGDTKYYTAVHVKTLIAQADEEIANLKSQLQQQALPVVPEFVGIAIESLPDHCSAFEAFYLIKSKVKILTEENKDWLQVYNWLCEGVENQNIFALAFITGKYEVEKPQLFYLKNKLTGAYLYYDEATKLYSDIVGNVEDFFGTKTKFTEAEICSMETGSYEQIEVEK